MATPNPNDNTQLGTGELISNESIETAAGVTRADPNLPVAAYKVPRSKIVVGDYGADLGDATHSRPFPVESQRQRQIAECEFIQEQNNALRSRERSYAESGRYNTFDLRGQSFDTRGKR